MLAQIARRGKRQLTLVADVRPSAGVPPAVEVQVVLAARPVRALIARIVPDVLVNLPVVHEVRILRETFVANLRREKRDFVTNGGHRGQKRTPLPPIYLHRRRKAARWCESVGEPSAWKPTGTFSYSANTQSGVPLHRCGELFHAA